MNFNKTILMLAIGAFVVQANAIAKYEGKHSVDLLLKKAKKIFTDLKIFKRCKKSEHGCPSELKWRLQKRSSCLAKKIKTLVGVKFHHGHAKHAHHYKQETPPMMQPEKGYFSRPEHDSGYYSNTMQSPFSDMSMPTSQEGELGCPCHRGDYGMRY